MSAFQYKSGLGNSAAYQVSGYPQVNSGTGDETINYDYVTSEISVLNANSSGRVTLYFDGATEGLKIPAACCAVTLIIKCRQVEVVATNSPTWSICAALTTIDKSALPEP